MNSQFLMVPFPPTKNKDSRTDNALNSVFGGNAQNVVSIAKRTRFPTYDEQAFKQYIPMLNTLLHAKVPTSYTNPFKSAYYYDSNDGKVEVVNTLWNYLATLHQRIQLIDSSCVDYLREFNPIMADCEAITENLAMLLSDMSHPFFNMLIVEYTKAYHKYLISLWQVAILQVSGKNPNYLGRQALTAIEQLKECVRVADQMPDVSRSYFYPISTLSLAYYQAYAYLQFGNFQKSNQEYALAIQAYRTGFNFINRKVVKVDFCQFLSNAVTTMKKAIETTKDFSERENREVYMVRIPEGDYNAPKPFPLQNIKMNEKLLISQLFKEVNEMIRNDPFKDMQAPEEKEEEKEIDPFSDWEVVSKLKSDANDKANHIQPIPEIKFEIDSIKQQLSIGANSDNLISSMINEFRKGNPSIIRETVQNYIRMAKDFYTSINARLDKYSTS